MYRLSLSHEVYINSNADVNVAVAHFLAVQNLRLFSTYYAWRAAIKPSSNLKCSTANNLRSLSQTAHLASCCFFAPPADTPPRRRVAVWSPKWTSKKNALPLSSWMRTSHVLKERRLFLRNFAASYRLLEWRRCCHWLPRELCARTEL